MKEWFIMAKTGSLSINSENIFPIIKKWLYSDHDIFYRELVSNGCDAITKLKKLALMGEYEEPENPEYKVLVTVNPTDKTIKIEDNGLGMTEEEVDEYINQIAFSGAQDFLNKYKDKAGEDQIIGHFGLGFYSAFMVADRVEINTLSYKADAKPVHWVSDGGTEFEMTDGDKAGHGTIITLYLNEDSTEFANEFRAREVLQKYCAFMPVEIYVNDETREPMPETIEADELLDSDVIIETIVEEETKKYKIEQRPVPVNDTKPLWNKHPNECTEDEYKDFYRKVFQDYKEPLFWIHLNMDYPFNLKGILYFPKINMEYESIEGKIKLFNNQVFIADNIKEVIPEFLMLLKGTIDCPDLPLNVSRSALQNDGFVKKISDYITKKVADKLSGMCKTDRETYEKYWDDINPFIKFGCLKDEKFADKMNDYIIFKNLEDKYVTLKDYLEIAKEKNHENQVFYVTDAIEQSQYINMFKDAELEAVYLTQAIDNPFMSQLEYKNEGVKFQRIDADVNDIFKEADTETAEDVKTSLSDLFKSILGMEQLDVKVENLKNAGLASMITVSDESRRILEMMKMFSAQGMGMGADMFPVSETLVLNANNSLVKYVLAHKDGEHTAKICEQLYDLAKLAHGSLTPERMTKFIARSGEIMMLMTGEE